MPRYEFLPQEEDELTQIKITTGKYAGVIYSYGKVNFIPEIEVGKLQFNFEIVDSGELDVLALHEDQNFVTIMGDILTDIILNDDQTRTNHP